MSRTLDVFGCTCGKDHRDLPLMMLARAERVYGLPYNAKARCPVSGDVIYANVKGGDDDAGEDDRKDTRGRDG